MTNATVSRKDVMIAAWAAVKSYAPAKTVAELRRRLSRELAQAWFTAKRAAQLAAQTALEAARDALNILRNKANWTATDDATATALQVRIDVEIAAEVEADYAEKRDLIASAQGRFAAVTFIKADGSERTMKVQPAALKFHIKGDKASASAQQAVATRKARHPHLLNVWDVEARAPRSINLATVSCIALDGMAHAYQ